MYNEKKWHYNYMYIVYDVMSQSCGIVLMSRSSGVTNVMVFCFCIPVK